MELLVSRRSTDGQSAGLGEGFEPRRVVVALDATTKIKLRVLRYALNSFVTPGDNLSLVGIPHPFFPSVAYKQKPEGAPKFDGNVKNITQEEIWKKLAEFQKSLTEKEIYKLMESKKVLFDIHVATGPDRKLVTAKQLIDLRASWVILDQDLREDKAYLMEQLHCNVVLMNSKSEATIIKLKFLRKKTPMSLSGRRDGILPLERRERCDIYTKSVVSVASCIVMHTTFQSRTKLSPWYMAPEYAEPGSVSGKADLYSFGVLVLQLITGRKAIDGTRADGENCLTERVRSLIQAGKTLDIVDPRLRNLCDVAQVTKMVDVATRCISIDTSQRPDMSKVLSILECDSNLVSSISVGSPTNDVSDILRDPSTKCLLQTNLITLQGSVDSAHSKGQGFAPNGIAHPSQSNGTTHRSQSSGTGQPSQSKWRTQTSQSDGRARPSQSHRPSGRPPGRPRDVVTLTRCRSLNGRPS